MLLKYTYSGHQRLGLVGLLDDKASNMNTAAFGDGLLSRSASLERDPG